MKAQVFFFILLLKISTTTCQNLARISGNLIIKEKDQFGKFSITSGKFYYDTKINKLIYNIVFPQKTTWVAKDTTIYKIENNKIVERKSSFILPEYSIFGFALNGNLQDYGMKKSGYKITDISKSEGKVFLTYSPQQKNSPLGKIIIAQQNNILVGVLFYNPQNKLLSKQFFKKYISQKGINFPTEIVAIKYVDNKELYTITNYDKININDFKDTKNYDPSITLR